ncbi:MAG: hypothetical protein AB1414_19975, partial [bacterium]
INVVTEKIIKGTMETTITYLKLTGKKVGLVINFINNPLCSLCLCGKKRLKIKLDFWSKI